MSFFFFYTFRKRMSVVCERVFFSQPFCSCYVVDVLHQTVLKDCEINNTLLNCLAALKERGYCVSHVVKTNGVVGSLLSRTKL